MCHARPACATFLGSATNLLEERAPPDYEVDVARPRRRRPVDEVHVLPVWRRVDCVPQCPDPMSGTPSALATPSVSSPVGWRRTDRPRRRPSRST